MDSKYSIPFEYNWSTSIITYFDIISFSYISISQFSNASAKFLGNEIDPYVLFIILELLGFWTIKNIYNFYFYKILYN